MSHFFPTIISNIIQTKRSPRYSLLQKIKVFHILNCLCLKAFLYPSPKESVSQKIFNYSVSAYSYSELLYLFREIFLHQNYHFATTNKVPSIIDAGANIGMSIIYFKTLYPDCSILAFEPNPYAFDLLRKNVNKNNLTKVDLHNAAISDQEGFLSLFINEHRGSLLASLRTERGGTETAIVNCQKLSTYLQKEKFDLLKMDIEGAEIKVLTDLLLSNTLSQIDQYLIEYHHKIGKDKSLLSCFLAPFESEGYEYNLQANRTNPGEFQDILIHFYR